MAVMTYEELKKRGLDHGEMWFGLHGHLRFYWPESTYLIKINFDKKDCDGRLNVLECYELLDDFDINAVFDNWYVCTVYKYKSALFAPTKEELIEYCKNAPIRIPRFEGVSTLGYKLLLTDKQDEYALCVLEIPPEAKCTSPYFETKCRANMIKVREIRKLNKDGSLGEELTFAYSPFAGLDNRMTYEVGDTLTSEFNPSRLFVCTKGLHFYMTQKEVLDLYKEMLNFYLK